MGCTANVVHETDTEAEASVCGACLDRVRQERDALRLAAAEVVARLGEGSPQDALGRLAALVEGCPVVEGPMALDGWERELVGKRVRRPDGEEFVVDEILEELVEGEVVFVAHGEHWFEYADLVELAA